MDDDDISENGGGLDNDGNATAHATPSAASAPATTTTTTSAPRTSQDAPQDQTGPAKPARPLTEQQKNEIILKEAFPSIELSIIKAVLAASGGRIDPAFNALLGMSDPDAVQNEPVQEEEVPPPPPPRPTGRAPLTQMEADELYARQLAEQYENAGAYEERTMNRGPGGAPKRQATGLKPNEMYDREHSFIDDDLPVIKENLRKGFMDTQKQVNTWFTSLKKKLDDAYNEDEDESQPSRHHRHGGRRSGESSRRSADYERYDADPQVLSDDFAGMRLQPDGCKYPAPLTPRGYNKANIQAAAAPGRPSSSSNIYRPSPPPSTSPKPEGRKVAFRETVEDIDAYDASPRAPPKDSRSTPPPGKQSKWQPLSSVEPNPIADNDPFSLGDSEDEKDNTKGGDKAIKMEDSERLKQATADAMADSLVDKDKQSGGKSS